MVPLSNGQQKLLCHAFNNGGFIEHNKKIYSSSSKYYKTIKLFLKFGLIGQVCCICNRPLKDLDENYCSRLDEIHFYFLKNKRKKLNKKIYKLTVEGEAYASISNGFK